MKHVIGELGYGSHDLFDIFPAMFVQDLVGELGHSEIRRETIF